MKEGVTFHIPLEEDIYDWGGEQLYPEIRSHLAVGDTVRIQVAYGTEGLGEAIYVEITDVVGSDLIGSVLPTYRQFFEGETIYIENGETIRFPRACVMEIPIGWNQNEALRLAAKQTGLGRTITGMMTPNAKDSGRSAQTQDR